MRYLCLFFENLEVFATFLERNTGISSAETVGKQIVHTKEKLTVFHATTFQSSGNC